MERDRQCFISFALEIELLFSKNNVLCQPSILLVFSEGDLILPTVKARRYLYLRKRVLRVDSPVYRRRRTRAIIRRRGGAKAKELDAEGGESKQLRGHRHDDKDAKTV